MNYISIFDRLTHKRLCFLKNAYDINYTLNLNGLHTAEFTLPSDDIKNQYCKPLNYVEIWDNDKRVELFRILPSKFTKNASTKTITYECEHVLATLLDDIMFKFHTIGNTGTYTPTVIEYILARQEVKRWNLQECDFSHQFLYTWENENLLSALFSVANPFTEDYIWQTDTNNMNAWQISLKIRNTTTQKGELRYRKNMQGVVKSTDPTNLCTRLYLLGYGEGDNQLGISSVNNGIPYLDSDTINQYGLISKIAVDRRYQVAENLLEYGKNLLNEVKFPYISYEIEAAAIETNEEIHVGDIIRIIDDEEKISELMPVIAIEKSDITGAKKVKYTIANKPQDIAQTMADISDRQRIADLYSQGSVNIDSVTFQDNADSSNPATLRFYISDKVVRINSVNLTYKLTSFRAYSKSASAGGGSVQSSSSGGGSTQTSSSGGGSSTTSDSGGGDSVTSDSVKVVSSNIADLWFKNVYTEYSSATGSHRHKVGDFGIDFPTIYTQPHSHRIKLDSHTHRVSIPSHTHSVSIPSHSHTVTIPDHTHGIVYGIYNGGSANSAQIKVDGRLIPYIPQNGNVDVVNYLSVDDEGKIQRGTWHEIEIIPNALTRIEASVQNIVFINPRGGSDL